MFALEGRQVKDKIQSPVLYSLTYLKTGEHVPSLCSLKPVEAAGEESLQNAEFRKFLKVGCNEDVEKQKYNPSSYFSVSPLCCNAVSGFEIHAGLVFCS